MVIEEIENEILAGSITPNRLAELRMTLSVMFSRTSAELEQILEAKALQWTAMRPNMKSDASTDKWWEGIGQGISEMKLRNMLKRQEIIMRGISSLLRVAEGNAKNQY